MQYKKLHSSQSNDLSIESPGCPLCSTVRIDRVDKKIKRTFMKTKECSLSGVGAHRVIRLGEKERVLDSGKEKKEREKGRS